MPASPEHVEDPGHNDSKTPWLTRRHIGRGVFALAALAGASISGYSGYEFVFGKSNEREVVAAAGVFAGFVVVAAGAGVAWLLDMHPPHAVEQPYNWEEDPAGEALELPPEDFDGTDGSPYAPEGNDGGSSGNSQGPHIPPQHGPGEGE